MIEINKPSFDNRKFFGGELSNGIKYSIINDDTLKNSENSERSFVSVCLKVGSFADPIGYEGLAHFLEHMLFMGSEKYPDENYYNTRLNELGGYSNAYTDVMETVYYFNVYNNGLEEIFDIFSRFFIDPLFAPDSVSREINAVDSEHKKNINQDLWRKYQLMLHLTDPESLTNTFVTGSLNSLLKPDIRDQVIKFYKKYYTTDNISICINSSNSVDEIYQIITKTFGHIPKSESNKLIINKPFFNQNISKTFHLKSVSNIYEISYIWEIPFQTDYLNSKDFNILEMMITNKSDKSLYFHLKNKGYLNNIYSEIRHEGMFIIKFRLTKEGFNNLNYIHSVLDKFLNQLMNMDLEVYAKYYQQVMKINFNCMNKFDREDLCNLLAVNHHYYPTENIFGGSFMITEIKTVDEYKKLFNKYINFKNCVKILASHEIKINNLEYRKLPEYDADFAEIPDNFKQININENICCFDIKNEYLDVESKLIGGLDKYDIPKLISERQWYGGCTKFGEPQVRMMLQFNNLYFNSAHNYVLTNISCAILNFLSTIILYKPQEICYSIVFEPRPVISSILVKITGLNDIDKLKLLINDISDFIINAEKLFDKISKEYIDNLIISFKESYQNTKYLNPWEYTNYIIRIEQLSTEYKIEDLIKELDNIDFNMIKKYLANLLDNSALTTFVYGNIESNDLIGLFDKFEKLFKNPSYPLPKINSIKDISLIHPNKQEKSNCISLLYPVGKFTPKEFNLLNLSMNILSQSFFDKLRTKNQLGYLVRMNFINIRDEYFILQKIQSEKTLDIVETKINNFNKKLIKLIDEVDFDKFIDTLKSQLLELDYSLDERFNRYSPEINLRQYLFNRNDILLKQLINFSKKDLVNFIKKFITKENAIKITIIGN